MDVQETYEYSILGLCELEGRAARERWKTKQCQQEQAKA